MAHADEVMTAVRRSDRALAEQVCEFESLEFGVAYFSGRLPASIQTCQLRDVWLADVSPEEAYDRAESFYRERNLTCFAWTPASKQAIEPIEHLLVRNGWRRVDYAAMSLENGELLNGPSAPQIRALPARAMPKALRETFSGDGASAEIAIERMNDSHLDPFIALWDKTPAGRINYLEVGDIARLMDFFVVPEMRRKGVGRALLAHVYHLARRLLPKALVLSVPVSSAGAIDFLARVGFTRSGTTTQFVRQVD